MSYNVAAVNDILPKLIRSAQNLNIAQARFFKEIEKAKTTDKINSQGHFIPYQTLENNQAFAVGEGGPILTGGEIEFAMGSVALRQHWSPIMFTGKLERQKSKYMTKIDTDPKFGEYSKSAKELIAQNYAVDALIKSTFKMYGHRSNFFALQGSESSAIAIVTNNPGSNQLDFAWASTDAGNRMLDKNQQVQVYDGSNNQRTGGLSLVGSGYYITVASMVDKTSANATNGRVTFNAVPTSTTAGDKIVFRNSFGLMPMGVPAYVGNTGNFNGIARSTNPNIFNSVIQTLTSSPTLTVNHVRSQLSQMQSRMGYDTPFMVQIWLNKATYYDYESQAYGSPFVRNLGPGQVKTLDLSVGEIEHDGKKFMIDPHVPPSKAYFLNMLTWEKVEQTPMQPYAFDSGSYLVNPLNSSGERLDVRSAAIFSEYNYFCTDPRCNGWIEGLGFNPNHV